MNVWDLKNSNMICYYSKENMSKMIKNSDGKLSNSDTTTRHGDNLTTKGQLGTGGKLIVEKGKLIDPDNGNV